MDYSDDYIEGKEVLEIQSRVKKGIKWLDKTFGRDKWKKKIDLNNLDLSSPNTCMIGEICGEYSELETRHGVDDEHAEEMGFFLQNTEQYSILTATWIGVLTCMGIKPKKAKKTN